MTAILRQDIIGGAKPTTLDVQLIAGATSLSVPANGLTTWTPVTHGRIPVIINHGEDDEERLFATAVSGDSLTGLSRGQDGTIDQVHPAGATVTHGLFASHIDATNELLSLPTTKGDLLVASAVDNWQRQAVGANGTLLAADSTQANGVAWTTAPTIGDFTNANHDHLDADDGGTLTPAAVPALVAAYTAYSPTLSGFTAGNGTVLAEYRQIGKVVDVIFTFVAGTTSTFTGTVVIGLPTTGVGFRIQSGTAFLWDDSTAKMFVGLAMLDSVAAAADTGAVRLLVGDSAAADSSALYVGALTPGGVAWATDDAFHFQLRYQAA